jgi:hypothetical protein
VTRPTWLESVTRSAQTALAGAPATRPRSWIAGLRHALAWGAEHTGLPVIVVAAIALVVAFRLAKRTAHFAIELAVAVTLLFVASKMGWIRW